MGVSKQGGNNICRDLKLFYCLNRLLRGRSKQGVSKQGVTTFPGTNVIHPHPPIPENTLLDTGGRKLLKEGGGIKFLQQGLQDILAKIWEKGGGS